MKKIQSKLCRHKFAVTMLFSLIIGLSVFSSDAGAAQEDADIVQTEADKRVIPDKYNTMPVAGEGGFTTVADEGFSVTSLEGKQQLVKFQGGAKGERKINLQYANKNLEGTFIIENVDFSATIDKLTILSEVYRDESKKKLDITFKNCVFRTFSAGRDATEYVKFKFENCSFESINGSNLELKRCYLGGGIEDRIIPFSNFTIIDSYIANPTSLKESTGEIHVDGVQIYGWKTVEAHDIKFDGCRFEMPAITYENAPKSYVNACIMLQLEFNNGRNISFENCYINGGGFAVYASSKADKTTGEDWTYENTYFKNLKFGCASRWGKVYTKKQHPDVQLNKDTWTDADSIYVGTVSRDKKNKCVNLCVANDTNEDRTFAVYTSSGKKYDFTIEACPKWSQINGRKFEELPFDNLYTIPEDAEWIVCYETTNGAFNQVRYENWTDKELVLTKDTAGNQVVKEKGKNVTYEVKDIVLNKNIYTYTGKEIKPQVTVKDTEGNIIGSEYYSVKYVKNKNSGIATVNVMMKAPYNGTYNKTFTIKPVVPAIAKLTVTKNSVNVTLKKCNSDISGYVIELSTDRQFKNGSVVSHRLYKTLNSKTFRNLKPDTVYYVRVKTYKTTNVAWVNKNVYSDYTKTLSTKTAKTATLAKTIKKTKVIKKAKTTKK